MTFESSLGDMRIYITSAFNVELQDTSLSHSADVDSRSCPVLLRKITGSLELELGSYCILPPLATQVARMNYHVKSRGHLLRLVRVHQALWCW